MTEALDFTRLGWLMQVEAAMAIHRRTYPFDSHWRRWIRRQELPSEWFDRLRWFAADIVDGRASRFIDADEAPRTEGA